MAATMLPPTIQAISAAITICVPRNGVSAENTPTAKPSATACGVALRRLRR